MKSLYSLLLCVCSFIGFAQPNPVEIKIDPENMPEGKIGLYDIVESIEYVPLETKEECLIGNGVLCDMDDQYMLISYPEGDSLYLFDRKGKFIRSIGTQGIDPEEYMYAGYSFLDTENRCIIVADRGKALFFDLRGRFLWSSPIPIDDRTTQLYSHGRFIRMAKSYLYRDSVYSVYTIYDQKGKLRKEAVRSVRIPLQADKAYRIAFAACTTASAYVYNNMPHVWEYLNDTVYVIDGLNNFHPKYVFHLGKYKVTPEIQGDMKHFHERAANCVIVNALIETSDYLLIQYYYQSYLQMKSHYCYYDKKEKRTYRFDTENGFPNDYDGGFDFKWNSFLYQRNNLAYTYLMADNFVDTELRSEQTPRGPQSAVQAFEKLVKKVDPDDNPIIMIVKLKG